MIKIKEFKIRKDGLRGQSVYLPTIYAKDNNLDAGDTLDVYRSVIKGVDALVIIPASKSKEINIIQNHN